MANVHGKAPALPHQSHQTGFDAALDAALLAASGLGHPGDYTVTVELFAEITVTNPGQIQQYGAILTQRAPVPDN